MTTPDDSAYEKVLLQRERNRRSYYKHHEERKQKSREYQRIRHANNIEYVKALQKAWNANNKDRINTRRKIVRPRYKERERAYSKRWNSRNPDKVIASRERNREKIRERNRDWYARNPDWAAAKTAYRRSMILQATPPWANIDKIRAVYAEAARRTREDGVTYHVDHIEPLKGRYSRGLHVHWNLQILTAAENCRKSNKCPQVSTIN